MVKKIINLSKFLLLFLILFTFFNINIVRAEDFTFEYEISNTINSDLKLITEYKVVVINNSGKDFISKTQIIYPFKPESVKATNEKETLNTITDRAEDGDYIININQRPAFGAGSKLSYTVTVQTTEAVVKKGDLTDISIPGLTESSSVKVKKNSLRIAKSLHSIKYISKISLDNEEIRKLNTTDSSYVHYSFSDSNPISVLLGEKSNYNFTMTILPQDNTVYFPKNAETQNIQIDTITNPPADTLYDNDSNIVLNYQKDADPIVVKGLLEVLTDKYKAEEIKLETENTFWKYDKRLDNILNDVDKQPTEILKVKTAFAELSKIVKYNPENKTPKRLETKEILDNPNSLHSINISDLAITLLREAKVNVRLVGGFVDTLVSKEFTINGLQFWIEYYDANYKGWKEANPTLQFLSPLDNNYDGVGLSHIQIFKSSSGWKIPSISSYKLQAELESGAVVLKEKMDTILRTEQIQSGKDKFIEIIIRNIGNTVSHIKNLSVKVGDSTETSDINKIIFPNQFITVDAKIKNDNYYENKTNTITVNIATDLSNYSTDLNLKFSQSNEILLIVGIILTIIISIMIGVFIFGIRRRRYLNSVPPKVSSKKKK